MSNSLSDFCQIVSFMVMYIAKHEVTLAHMSFTYWNIRIFLKKYTAFSYKYIKPIAIVFIVFVFKSYHCWLSKQQRGKNKI